jgi:hypothetical protein
MGIAFAALVALLVGLGGVPSSAAAEPTSDAISDYMRATGVSVTDAEKQVVWQDEAGQLSDALRASEPTTFGGLFIEHTPTYKVVVLSTSGDAAAIDKYAAGLSLKSVLDVRAADYSLEALEADQLALGKALGLSFPVDLSVKQNRVVVEVPKGGKSLAADVAAALPSTAVILQNAEPRTPTVQLYGGLAVSTCTLGFSVYFGGNTSNRRVVTAGHCPNSQSYNGQALTYMNDGIWSGNYDAQTHTLSGATYANKVVDGDGTPRTITSRSLTGQNVGAGVCKYGKVTGYDCGIIVSDHDPGCSASPGGAYRKVDSDPNGTGVDMAEPGDSGGPWFFGNTAWGIASCEQGFDGIYSPTVFFEGAVNVTVLTFP